MHAERTTRKQSRRVVDSVAYSLRAAPSGLSALRGATLLVRFRF